MRIFVAAWPTPEVVEAIRAIPRPAHPKLRWTSEATWHATLRFLGELDQADVDELARRLAGVARPATASAGPAIELVNRSVLGIPVRGLDALAGAVLTATRDIGQAPDSRPFRGHITIGRARGRDRVDDSWAGGPFAAAWAVTEVAVVRSLLGPNGPTYETIACVTCLDRGGPSA